MPPTECLAANAAGRRAEPNDALWCSASCTVRGAQEQRGRAGAMDGSDMVEFCTQYVQGMVAMGSLAQRKGESILGEIP